MASEYLKRIDVQGHLRVQEALREWDPIGCGVPPDEYDGYAPQVVRLLDAGVPKSEIVAYLRSVCVDRMGCPFDPVRTGKIVDDLLAYWPPWKERVRQQLEIG
jgi:hypothetical protein